MAQVIIKQAERELVIQLTKDIISIGRSTENDIVLRGKGISRRHCEIRKVEDDYHIVDLKSRNGTYVNSNRFKEQKLVLGDCITIGDATIIFEKELPLTEESTRTGELGQINDFIVAVKKKQWGILPVIGIITLVIIGFIIWRSLAGHQAPQEDKNLLGPIGSFDSPEVQNGQMPPDWLVADGTTIRVAITQEEAHSGPNSLLVETSKSDEFYTEFRCRRLINLSADKAGLSPSVSAYSFGGWVKSKSFNKSLAGFKLEWFQRGETIPFAESYTPLFRPASEWQEKVISVMPPEDARTVRFSGIIAGTDGKIYFDDLRLSPAPFTSTQKGKGFRKETDHLVLRGNRVGTWLLHTKDGLTILRCGGLTINSKTGESYQGFSDQGKIPFSDPIEWLDYEMNLEASDNSLTINYLIPFQKSIMALEGTYVSFIVDPQLITGKVKILSDSLKELSYQEPIKEKDVSQIDLEIDNHILSVKYPVPLEVMMAQKGNVLEFKQGWFEKQTLIHHGKKGIKLALEFKQALRTAKETPAVYNQMLEKAQQQEAEKKLGRAIKIYREIMERANKKSEAWRQAYNRSRELNQKAQTSLAKINHLIKEADLISDKNIYEQADKLCQDVINDYKGSEFTQPAVLLRTQIQEKISALASTSIQEELNRLMSSAEGYFREKNWTSARLFYEEIIRLGKLARRSGEPENEIVKKAHQRLKDIEEKETTD